jgi:hypothetical protein
VSPWEGLEPDAGTVTVSGSEGLAAPEPGTVTVSSWEGLATLDAEKVTVTGCGDGFPVPDPGAVTVDGLPVSDPGIVTVKGCGVTPVPDEPYGAVDDVRLGD